MGPWLYGAVVAAVVILLLLGGLAARAARRSRRLETELSEARGDVRVLSTRVQALADEVDEARRVAEERAAREVEPVVVTGLVADDVSAPGQQAQPRDVQVVQAIESGRPEWVPAGPLREALIKTISFAHGVRRALGADIRDRVLIEARAEVRRSRRQRKAEVRAVRKYLRDRRKHVA